jgi:hypothetical protein
MSPPRELRLVLALALSAAPGEARADVDLTVTRDAGAQGCPSAAEVRRLALLAVAPSVPPPAHSYRISFARSDGSYRAEIVDDTAGRSRRLEDVATACGPLGQAAAVVMATMWSSERDEASLPPAVSPAPPPTQPQVATPPETPTPVQLPTLSPAVAPSPEVDRPPVAKPAGHRNLGWAIGAGAALTTAIVRPAAPALVGEGAVEFAHGSLAVGALWIPVQRFDVAPGSIGVELVSANLRGCGCCAFGGALQLGFCGSILAGALLAAGSGYTTDAERVRPWFAVEPEVYVDRVLFGWARGRAAVGAVVPLHAESFSVAGAGMAYATPPVGGLVSLSLEIAKP